MGKEYKYVLASQQHYALYESTEDLTIAEKHDDLNRYRSEYQGIEFPLVTQDLTVPKMYDYTNYNTAGFERLVNLYIDPYCSLATLVIPKTIYEGKINPLFESIRYKLNNNNYNMIQFKTNYNDTTPGYYGLTNTDEFDKVKLFDNISFIKILSDYDITYEQLNRNVGQRIYNITYNSENDIVITFERLDMDTNTLALKFDVNNGYYINPINGHPKNLILI